MTEVTAVVPLNKNEIPTNFIDLDLLEEVNNGNSMRDVVKRVGVTQRTLLKYRKLAYKYIPAYQQSCSDRYPEYELDLKRSKVRRDRGEKPKTVLPDPPPFTDIEVKVLEQIASLYSKGLIDEQVVKLLEVNKERHESSKVS
ncbi:MAG: hypothetical protein F6K21_03100 [Symploca sp. SIO2D2]|nr:hypothetical protein [Symploca sp. SIO2D2]NET62772.1 hypothetical protein [Symploca sp. SIO2E6]